MAGSNVTSAELDWRYNRSGCTTCKRATDFLERHKLEAREIVEAKKNTLKADFALKLAASVDEIYATKGTRQVHFQMKDKPAEEELLAAMLGPTGNLRAPALRKGKVLLIGFDEDSYKKVLTGK